MINLFKIAVIIPTYNPRSAYLQRTLDGLKNQDLPLENWQCIIVDNASTNGVIESIDVAWHPHIKIVKETKQGLTFARIKGYVESDAEFLVFVDDDNVLNPDYLSLSLSLFKKNPDLGTAGGRTVGEFEIMPPLWAKEFYSLIAIKEQNYPVTITSNLKQGYPAISPIGAGMIISRHCFEYYYNYINLSKGVIKDRTGNSLSSGGDNEINILALKSGYKIGYFPELSLKHLIGKERLTISYLKRLNYSSNISWIKLLHAHQICPWKPISKFSLPLRKIKAYLKYKPWLSPSRSINYAGACGLFKGLSELI